MTRLNLSALINTLKCCNKGIDHRNYLPFCDTFLLATKEFEQLINIFPRLSAYDPEVKYSFKNKELRFFNIRLIPMAHCPTYFQSSIKDYYKTVSTGVKGL